jgi:hypothetical protein
MKRYSTPLQAIHPTEPDYMSKQDDRALVSSSILSFPFLSNLCECVKRNGRTHGSPEQSLTKSFKHNDVA